MTIMEDRPVVTERIVPPAPPVAQSEPEKVPELTAREKAIKMIAFEAGCSERHAKKALRWIEKRVNEAQDNFGSMRMRRRHLRSKYYRTFDKVIGHDSTTRNAEPFTARAKIQEALLGTSRLSIMHVETHEYDVVCRVVIGHKLKVGETYNPWYNRSRRNRW